MPYYIQDFDNPGFRNRKRLFIRNWFVQRGFFDHLCSLEKAKTIILFGSFSRSDWNHESDIDIFIYGDCDGFEQGKYELLLKREIQIHQANNAKDLKKMGPLLLNIVSGYMIKGTLQNLGVKINA